MSFAGGCLAVAEDGSVDAFEAGGDKLLADFFVDLELGGLFGEDLVEGEMMILFGLFIFDGDGGVGEVVDAGGGSGLLLVEGPDPDINFDIVGFGVFHFWDNYKIFLLYTKNKAVF